MLMERYNMEKEFIEVLHSEHLQFREADPWLDAMISLHALNNMSLYIYGAGKDVDIFVKYLKDSGLSICGIIDKDTDKQKMYCEGLEIISPDEFKSMEKSNVFVFIYTLVVQGSSDEKQIYKVMNSNGVKDYCLVGQSRYSVSGILPQHVWINEGRRSYYKLHERELLETYNSLSDKESKHIMIEYIRAYIECSSYQLEELPSKWKYFFDKNCQSIYTHLDDEVWINCGADEGGTIAKYYQNGLRAKKIYAVEGNMLCVKKLENNLKFYLERMKNEVEIVSCYVDGKGELENIILQKEKITLINADIEGNELMLLKELRYIIQRDRPVIAICVYHRKEDLIEIPQYFSSTVEEYYFFLRKYATWLCGDSRRCFELVLYAVPKERVNYLILDNG